MKVKFKIFTEKFKLFQKEKLGYRSYSHFPSSRSVFCLRLLHVVWSPQKWNFGMIIIFRESTKDMNKRIFLKTLHSLISRPIKIASYLQGLQIFSSLQGCPNFFPLEHDLKLLEHQGLILKASLRREAPIGEGGGGGHPLPQVGVMGASLGNFWKIASKWCILAYFRVVNVEKLYEQNCAT